MRSRLAKRTRQTALATAALAGALAAAPATPASAMTVNNAVSQWPILVDGLWSGDTLNNTTGGPWSAIGHIDGHGTTISPLGEWQDVTPIAFISPPPGQPGPAIPTTLADPNANSLTYVANAPGIGEPDDEPEDDVNNLYLMYTYSPRTDTEFFPGEFIADIIFPIDISTDFFEDGFPGDDLNDEDTITRDIRVVIEGAGNSHDDALNGDGDLIPIDTNGDGVADSFSDSFYEVFVEIEGFDGERFDPHDLGIDAAIGFGHSPLNGIAPDRTEFSIHPPENIPPHLLVELSIPLLIDPDFSPGGPFGEGGGEDGSGYSPAPAFWGVSIGPDGNDEFTGDSLVAPINGGSPASNTLVQINPDGSVTVNPLGAAVNGVPEPVTAMLSLMGAGTLGVSLRRRRA